MPLPLLRWRCLTLTSILLACAATAHAFQDSIKQQLESLEKQRVSIQQQAVHQPTGQQQTAWQSADLMPSWPMPAATAYPLLQQDCPALEFEQIDSLIDAAAKKQSLDPLLLHAVMKQESGFKPCAISIKGALGLMQLMPATAQQFHVSDAFDPTQNTQAGAAFLKQLLDRYKGDLRLTLVAYNAGPLRADQPSDQPYPLETQNYVANILAELGVSDPPVETAPDADSEDPPADEFPPSELPPSGL